MSCTSTQTVEQYNLMQNDNALIVDHHHGMCSRQRTQDVRSQEYHVAQYGVLHHFYYEYHYSPHKMVFQHIMPAGDQKPVINLE